MNLIDDDHIFFQYPRTWRRSRGRHFHQQNLILKRNNWILFKSYDWIISPLPNWPPNRYGHVNNVQYLSFFDTAINTFLIHRGGFVPTKASTIGYCVHSSCDYFKPVSFPQVIEAGLFVSKWNPKSSAVTYEVGIFAEGSSECAAHGKFVHVFVESLTNKATEIPIEVQIALKSIERLWCVLNVKISCILNKKHLEHARCARRSLHEQFDSEVVRQRYEDDVSRNGGEEDAACARVSTKEIVKYTRKATYSGLAPLRLIPPLAASNG